MIEDVVDKVREDFVRNNVPATVQFGREFIAEETEPFPNGRVVFIPTNDTYNAPQYVQGRSFPDPDSDGMNPRAIWTRYEGAEVHIWAASIRDADGTAQLRDDYAVLGALINQTILSIHRANPGNYRIVRGTTDQRTVHARRGFLYILEIEVQVPITDSPWPSQPGTPEDTWNTVGDAHADITVQETVGNTTESESITT